MNRLYFIVLAIALPVFLCSQSYPWDNIQLTDIYKKQQVANWNNSGDFYVVDSIYCYLYVDSLQMQVPVSRSYNLAFTDQDGEILETLEQQYDQATHTWVNVFFTYNGYDDENNLTETIRHRWDTGLSDWVYDTKTLNEPNEFGNYTHVLNQNWNKAAGDWRNVNQQKLTFNDEGFIQLLEFEEWDTAANDWSKVFRIVYAVTPEGAIATTYFQLFINNSYQNISREIYSFDPVFADLETERLSEIWISDSMFWQRSSRVVKDYDSNANLATETIQKWDAPNNNWLNENRFLRNYNSNGDVTIQTHLTWNGQQWNNFFQTHNSYDSVFNQTRFEVFIWSQGEWGALNSCDLFWRFHHEVVSTRETWEMTCEFPNPYRPGHLVICSELASEGPIALSIFDLSGKMVYSKRIENQNFINIAEPIPTGLYVLNLSDRNGRMFSKKIVIVD
ncbi:MAG: T9SS type A sorting domain-containing protein [Bacteroidota bacterium]